MFNLNTIRTTSISTKIFDLTGEAILQNNKIHNPGAIQNIDIRTYKNGIYILNVSNENQSITRKFSLNY